jgi:hypothetical protein
VGGAARWPGCPQLVWREASVRSHRPGAHQDQLVFRSRVSQAQNFARAYRCAPLRNHERIDSFISAVEAVTNQQPTRLVMTHSRYDHSQNPQDGRWRNSSDPLFQPPCWCPQCTGKNHRHISFESQSSWQSPKPIE